MHMMAAFVSGMFWLLYWIVGGSGDVSSIFIYSLWYTSIVLLLKIPHPLSQFFLLYSFFPHSILLCVWKMKLTKNKASTCPIDRKGSESCFPAGPWDRSRTGPWPHRPSGCTSLTTNRPTEWDWLLAPIQSGDPASLKDATQTSPPPPLSHSTNRNKGQADTLSPTIPAFPCSQGAWDSWPEERRRDWVEDTAHMVNSETSSLQNTNGWLSVCLLERRAKQLWSP